MRIRLDCDDALDLAKELRQAARRAKRTGGLQWVGRTDGNGGRIAFGVAYSRHDAALKRRV